MKNKINKMVVFIVLFVVLLLVVLAGSTYLATYIGKLPINLPLMPYTPVDTEISSETRYIMDAWANYEPYVPTPKYDTVEQILLDANTNLNPVTREEMKTKFPYIDEESLYTWVANNPEAIKDGYERLFIDNVDYINSPTGIKTIYGDDVLALDVMDEIAIVGLNIQSDRGTSKVKLAIVNNKNQVDMSLVKDLSYWDVARIHAKANNAILAINASGYNWHANGEYATLYGAAKWHGEMVRKSENQDSLICFDEENNLSLATSIESAYNAVEMYPHLIKDGEVVYNPEDVSSEPRYAQSAIGQTYDGVTLMLVASGGTYGSGFGANASEILQVMQRYGADNAAILSGGSRTIMYWNGREVNETVGYSSEGVRLPNTFYVKPKIFADNSFEG